MRIGIYVKDPLLLSDFNETCVYWTVFGEKNIEMWNFMKIRPVGAELFHADRQTDMTKLIVCFWQICERPQNQSVNAVQGNNRCLF